MKRIYAYKGFVVTVELEAQWQSSGNASLRPPSGYAG